MLTCFVFPLYHISISH